MALNRKRLLYFERFFHPVAEQIQGAQDDIDLTRLEYPAPTRPWALWAWRKSARAARISATPSI